MISLLISSEIKISIVYKRIGFRAGFILSFFFFYDIDERRRYTKKVHPRKALVGPSIVKRRIRGDLWAG